MKRACGLAIALLFLAAPTWANVTLPALFGDNMVLQRDTGIRFWGWADPGEKITVTLADHRVQTITPDNGKWKVRIGPLDAGGPFDLTIEGKNRIQIGNVLVGDVWICSGQSNMQFAVSRADNPEKEIAAADYPGIRLFSVPRTVAEMPMKNVEGSWSECTPETVGGFSAVAYYFGRKLHRDLDVPIGLIHTSWGGTPAEAWTSHPTLERDDEFQPILDRWAQIHADYPAAQAEYEKASEEWQKTRERAREEGTDPPSRPRAPQGPGHQHNPAGLYNAMIAPLIPFAMKGAIWYQGESNAGRAYQYRNLFKTMISDWRDHWDRGDFPFLFVQLANYRQRAAEPGESDWAELREAQTMALDLPKTAMAVIIDIGEADDIHPKNKQVVGARLALGALKVAHGRHVAYSVPLYHSMTVDGARIRVRMKNIAGGLVAKNGASLRGFAIAGEDRKFVWAQAEIQDDVIEVRSDQVPEPVAVRYAWANNPDCNLYNEAGLPASPFRTDDWPGVTVDNK